MEEGRAKKQGLRYDQKGIVESFLPVLENADGILRESGVLERQAPTVGVLRGGLAMREFQFLCKLLRIPEEELCGLVGISNATLHRRKKSGRMATPESERVVRIARLFGMACEVFESEDGGRGWLKTENVGTGGETPLRYADTEFGAREVENLLGRIDHGVF